MDCSLTQISQISQIFIQVLVCSASCTIDLRNQRNLRGKEKLSGNYSHADLADFADNFCKEPKMKYDKLTIVGLPKRFKVYNVVDYLYPDDGQPESPDDVIYDFLPKECDEGEDAIVVYEYNESVTGVEIVYEEAAHALTFSLSHWASDADVRIYTKIVNAVLKKHPRARLYAHYDLLKGLTEDDEKKMIANRLSYVKRLLKTKEGFTMEGLFRDFTLKVAHLRPAPTVDIQALELRNMFVEMQWQAEEMTQ